jgi:hypothetical protein
MREPEGRAWERQRQERALDSAGRPPSSSHSAGARSATSPGDVMDGWVDNAEDDPATSEQFTFWTPGEQTRIGIGTIVRHVAAIPAASGPPVVTYGIVVSSAGVSLGLEHASDAVYEREAPRSPRCARRLASAVPSPTFVRACSAHRRRLRVR